MTFSRNESVLHFAILVHCDIISREKAGKKLQTHTYNIWMPRVSFTGQNLNKSLNTHWTNNPCKKNMPQELSKYITYILCCESWVIFTHIQLVQVILSWNKLFSSYWNLKESQKIPVGFKDEEGLWWQRQNKLHAENLSFEDWSPHISLTKKILLFKSINHPHTISQLKTNLFYLLMPWTFH